MLTYRIDKRNNMLNALAGSSCGQDKGILLLTYNALEKSIASYAALIWGTNASDSNFKKVQTAQNAALRTVTVAHKMASIDHLHQECLTLNVRDHSDMLFVQYLVNCGGGPRLSWHHNSKAKTYKGDYPLQTSLNCYPRLGASRKENIQNLHTHAVDSAIQLLCQYRVLKELPPPIADEEQRLNRRQRCTL